MEDGYKITASWISPYTHTELPPPQPILIYVTGNWTWVVKILFQIPSHSLSPEKHCPKYSLIPVKTIPDYEKNKHYLKITL